MRPGINARLRAEGVSPVNLGAAWSRVSAEVAEAMSGQLAEFARLPAFAACYQVHQFSARLPWPRTFEVELEVGLR